MEYLFNSNGKHIANFVNGQLHSTRGENIGHYLEQYEIFIDMNGRYLGEIVYKDRLMYNQSSQHEYLNYGNYGDYGNVGDYGDPGNYGSIGIVPGYIDIDITE